MTMQTLNCDTIMTALELWNKLRGLMKDEELGSIVLRRLFELQPKTKIVFGYNISEEVGKAQTSIHAVSLVYLFDSIFQILGPDVEFAETILAQIAAKHKSKGVLPSFLSYMGQAFVETFEEVLGKDSISETDVDAWDKVYETISNEIIKNMLA